MSGLTLKVAICLATTIGISECFVFPGNYVCQTPDGSDGECMAIHDCNSVLKLLQSYADTKSNPPENVSEYLRKLQCDSGSGPVRVCCPKKPIIFNRSKLRKPEELLPLDKCGKATDFRVAFGNKTVLFSFPWMAQLAYLREKRIEYLCGGTLISDRYVLTAAHCIPTNRYSTLLHVRLGEHNMSSPVDCTAPEFGFTTCAAPPQDIEIESAVRHPNFDAVELLNDIALVRLKRRANTLEDTVAPICLPVLPSVRNANLSKITITGWGLTEKDTRSDVLLYGVVSTMDKESCKKKYKNINVTDVQMCVGDESGVGSCKGDSGGPLQEILDFNGDARYIQYGVVSQGPTICGIKGLPGIHTRIEYYLDWILSNMKQ